MNVYDLYNDIGERIAIAYKQSVSSGVKFDNEVSIVAYINILDSDKGSMISAIGQLNDIFSILKRLLVEIMPDAPTFVKVDVMFLDKGTFNLLPINRHLYEYKKGKIYLFIHCQQCKEIIF